MFRKSLAPLLFFGLVITVSARPPQNSPEAIDTAMNTSLRAEGIDHSKIMWIEHYPVFDAFYMTLTTVTTVGYAEIRALSHAGRVFNSFLIFFGVTTIFLAVGAMTQTLIELELNQFFGKRRVKKMINKLEGHIILCGYGRVGRGAADELRKAGMPFVVIDHNDERVERAMTAGASVPDHIAQQHERQTQGAQGVNALRPGPSAAEQT
jgi:voltage-gated potassium channel